MGYRENLTTLVGDSAASSAWQVVLISARVWIRSEPPKTHILRSGYQPDPLLGGSGTFRRPGQWEKVSVLSAGRLGPQCLPASLSSAALR